MSLDIFSNRKKQETEKVKVIVDFRERNSLVPSALIKNNANVQFEQLVLGDYISGNYIIERKTISDLQASIIDKRIFLQLESLKRQENYLLILENSESSNKINYKMINGFIVYCIKNRIPLVMSNNYIHTAELILLLGKNKKKSTFSFRDNKKGETKEERAKYIMEGFPGIGPITATKLIEKFRSIKNIVNADEKSLIDVLGKKYNSFKEIIS